MPHATAAVNATFIVTGQLAEAADNFELCYSLTKGKKDWLAADGETSMHSVSCSNLTRIYTSIARHCSELNDDESTLQYLIRAYEKSKEGQSFPAINRLIYN